jgi:hypothetical protein
MRLIDSPCPQPLNAPAHKFTPANDFMNLGALSRNFVAPKLDVICTAASLTTPGRIHSPS